MVKKLSEFVNPALSYSSISHLYPPSKCLLLKSCLGLGAFLVERSFFPENERNDQEHVLKNIGTISKRTELNGTGIA